jgi:hypothetical protein
MFGFCFWSTLLFHGHEEWLAFLGRNKACDFGGDIMDARGKSKHILHCLLLIHVTDLYLFFHRHHIESMVGPIRDEKPAMAHGYTRAVSMQL